MAGIDRAKSILLIPLIQFMNRPAHQTSGIDDELWIFQMEKLKLNKNKQIPNPPNDISYNKKENKQF